MKKKSEKGRKGRKRNNAEKTEVMLKTKQTARGRQTIKYEGRIGLFKLTPG